MGSNWTAYGNQILGPEEPERQWREPLGATLFYKPMPRIGNAFVMEIFNGSWMSLLRKLYERRRVEESQYSNCFSFCSSLGCIILKTWKHDNYLTTGQNNDKLHREWCLKEEEKSEYQFVVFTYTYASLAWRAIVWISPFCVAESFGSGCAFHRKRTPNWTKYQCTDSTKRRKRTHTWIMDFNQSSLFLPGSHAVGSRIAK